MAREECGFEERNGVEFSALGGMEHGKVDGHGVSALVGAVAKNDPRFREDKLYGR